MYFEVDAKNGTIIIDDFHHNPEEVRQFALNAGYPEPNDGFTYPVIGITF